jgi:hypothetical protein
VAHGEMAERSKAPESGSGLFGGGSSNLPLITACPEDSFYESDN